MSSAQITLQECRSDDAASPSASSVLIVLPDEQVTAAEATQLVKPVCSSFRTFVLTSALPEAAAVESYVPEILAALRAKKIKKATVYGGRRGAAVAMAMAVSDPKLVRRLVLLDATARMAPSRSSRVIDWFEDFLPLGLPLRNRSPEFDARPMLHRIHCPSLVLATKNTSQFVLEQSKEISQRIPNAWFAKLNAAHRDSAGQYSEELSSLLREFLQVPVKRSQRAV